jgi:hypothetical protein
MALRKEPKTTRKASKPPDTETRRPMPRDVGGTMPSNVMFPRLQKWADNIKPNPAENIEGKNYTGPGRFIGDFTDGRKDSRKILNIPGRTHAHEGTQHLHANDKE